VLHITDNYICIYTCPLRLSTCPLSTHAFTLVHLLKRFGGHLGYLVFSRSAIRSQKTQVDR